MTDAPETIGRYQVRRMIGQGGMGMVLLAWDPLLDREVAIKLLREDDDELRERFAREARSAAKLRHPNVVTIFDVGEHDGRPFIAMEYIEGETLAAIIRDRKSVPTPKRLQYIEGLCDGLSFAHRLGIVHRDVKPANVMVEPHGGVKILDFGIARASESVRLTRAGMLIGTLNYMSPEQVMGKTVDHRSDIFAVGLVFYELLAYQKAFPGKALADLIDKIVKSAPPPLAELRVGLDPEVIHIVEKAMEKDPAARYQDLGSMRKDLERVRRRLETVDEPTQPMRVPTEFLKPSSQQKAEAERLAEEQRKEAARLEQERRKEEERKKAEAARRAEAERLAEERRKEEERQAEIRRKEAAARARRIAEGVAAARAAIGREEFDAAAASLDALERADGAAPEIAEAREEVRAARAAAEAARVRAAVEAELSRGRTALAAEDFAAAETAAAAAVKLDGRHDGARAFQRAVTDAIRADAERRAEAERAARAKRIAEGVAAARAATGREEFDAAAASLDALERADG
ncbi:MAG TPA: serine/threonine-protein kinase, partial [Vicinamibacterales bacterium]|nr:serine/threonine-protein kinase [Vicinamibacterales bacterium]